MFDPIQHEFDLKIQAMQSNLDDQLKHHLVNKLAKEAVEEFEEKIRAHLIEEVDKMSIKLVQSYFDVLNRKKQIEVIIQHLHTES